MNYEIYALTAQQAAPLEKFILPEVRVLPERDSFWYFAAVSEENGIIGAAVIDPVSPVAQLLSIAVSPDMVRRGVASAIIEKAASKLKEAEIQRLEVTDANVQMEWEEMDQFLIQNGFSSPLAEQHTYDPTLGELACRPLLGNAALAQGAVTLASLSDLERRRLATQTDEMGLQTADVLREYDPEMSFIRKGKNGAECVLLLSPLQNDKIAILWTWLSPAANPKVLMSLLAAAVQKAAKTYPNDTKVVFTCLRKTVDDILHHFMPEIQPIMSMRTYSRSTEPFVHQTEESVAYWNDLKMEAASDKDLYCADCKHRKEELLSCVKYKMKPGDVLYGAPCHLFEK